MFSPESNYSLYADTVPLVEYRQTDKRNPYADAYFRACKGATNKAATLRVFKAFWPGYVPEAFYTPGRYRIRKAYEALRGQNRVSRSDACGPLGRLRIIVGQPLAWSCIPFDDLPSVEAFVNDPDAQFAQQVLDWVKEDLIQIIEGGFVCVVERGFNGRNHVHVFHAPGTCPIGYTQLVPDEILIDKAGYIFKKPYWNDANALAYLDAADLNGRRVPKRILVYGLGDSRTRKITIRDVEQATGIDLFLGFPS